MCATSTHVHITMSVKVFSISIMSGRPDFWRQHVWWRGPQIMLARITLHLDIFVFFLFIMKCMHKLRRCVECICTFSDLQKFDILQRKEAERADRKRRAEDPSYDELHPKPERQPENWQAQPSFEAVNARAHDLQLWLFYPKENVHGAAPVPVQLGTAIKAPAFEESE